MNFKQLIKSNKIGEKNNYQQKDIQLIKGYLLQNKLL